VVTAHIDSIDFHHPVHIGEVIMLKASVNYAGRTSMEIGVRVEAENLATGAVIHTNSAYLVFVALDHEGRPTEVPELVPETDEEKRRYVAAKERRARRTAGQG
jgi:acyl-CoA hydrolase